MAVIFVLTQYYPPPVRVQVTHTEARLVSLAGEKLLAVWKPSGGARIGVAAASATQVLLALSGGDLVYLELSGTKLEQKATVKLEHEVACLDLRPAAAATAKAADQDVDMDGGAAAGSAASASATASAAAAPCTLAAVGLWTSHTVHVLQLPSLKELAKEALGGDIQPRSVLFATLEGSKYLFVGLGDGHLVNYQLDDSAVRRTCTARNAALVVVTPQVYMLCVCLLMSRARCPRRARWSLARSPSR